MWSLWGSQPTGWDLLLKSFVDTIFKLNPVPLSLTPVSLSFLSPRSPPHFPIWWQSLPVETSLSPLNWAAELSSWKIPCLISIRMWTGASEPTRQVWQHTLPRPTLGREMKTVFWVSLANLVSFNEFWVSERPWLKKTKEDSAWGTIPEPQLCPSYTCLHTSACTPVRTHAATHTLEHTQTYIHTCTYKCSLISLHSHLRQLTTLISKLLSKITNENVLCASMKFSKSF